MISRVKQDLSLLFNDVLVSLFKEQKDILPIIFFEKPKDVMHGDCASNIAMQISKLLKKNPNEIAKQIVNKLEINQKIFKFVKKIEIAGPGFINLYLRNDIKQSFIKEIITLGENYGTKKLSKSHKVIVEFVSANPTGPLHVGHGRQAALGDAICNILISQGFEVFKEFFYNDAGLQILMLSESVQSRMKGIDPGDENWPQNGYQGEYINDIAKDFLAKKTVKAINCRSIKASGDVEDLESIRNFAITYLRNEQDIDLSMFGVKFDNYFLESSLYKSGKVDFVVKRLNQEDKTYKKDGALWFKTKDFGDDKDRVIMKKDGTFTYFVPDIAYHIDKWERGFKNAINIQGSDHQGVVLRVKSGLKTLIKDINENFPKYLLHKMVRVVKDGKEVKISKRSGSYVTLRDLIEWSSSANLNKEDALHSISGRDAVRFFLVSRKADSEFIFDVNLALKQTDDNPVYYIQYAHARICSILEQWGGKITSLDFSDVTKLVLTPELRLMSKLSEFPEILTKAKDELGPHYITFFLRELASEFHSYYNAEKVLVGDEILKNARLTLLVAVKQVLSNGLKLIGVSAPKKM